MKAGHDIGAMVCRLFAAPLIWFAHLNVLYGVHTLMCAQVMPGHFQTFVVVASVVALVAVAAVARMLNRTHHAPAIDRMSWGLAALSFLGICWTGIAICLSNLSC